MHSTGSISARRQSITRPAHSGLEAAAGGQSARSVETRWLPATSARCANQKADIAVSTRPLSGTGSSITTSNAEMRSEVTISHWPSPAS